MFDSTKFFGYFLPALFALGVTFPCCDTSAEAWELTTLHKEVPGTRYVETGKFEKAIRISNNLLNRALSKQAPEYQQVAVFTNLCIAHISLYEYERAEIFCRRAAAEPSNRSVTFNNLGVLYGLRGDHESAARHFEIAASADCLGKCSRAGGVPKSFPRPTARRNLNRAESLSRAEGESYFASEIGSTLEEFE